MKGGGTEKKHRRFRFSNLSLTTRFSVVILVFMVVPIGILAGIIFYNMEQDIIDENRQYMAYRLEETKSGITADLDSIHMSTRFFASDERLLQVLNAAYAGETLSAEDLVRFHDNDAADLERMVANNPSMYTARVYGINDSVTEMQPLLYQNRRLRNLCWGNDAQLTGWHIGYADTSFGSLTVTAGTTLIGLVTPVSGYEYGTVGYVEAAMKMETAFPAFYADEENGDWAFLLDRSGRISHGTNWPDGADLISSALKDHAALPHREGVESFQRNGRSYIVLTIPVKDLSASYIGVRDITDQIGRVHMLRNAFVVTMSGFLILLWFMLDRLVVAGMFRKFYRILDTERMIRKNGDFSLRIEERPGETDEMEELAHQTNRMLDSLEQLNRENVEREVMVRNTSIKALQNQINAHFIYNVLESIKMLAEIDEEYVISDSITSLGKLLRYSIRWTSGNVSMGEELEYIRNYISLMNLRNDFTVHLAENIPEDLMGQEIPKMSLQPVVENSIIHGIAPLGEDASIYIKARREGDTVRIEISDNGVGMEVEVLDRLRQKLTGQAVDTGSGHGVGLKNVEDRIHLSFGQAYGMSIWSEEGKYTKTVLTLPYRLSAGKEER